MTGSTISHYKILRELGRGGMGVVYEAEDLKLGRRVALKFLSRQTVTEERSRQRFLLEARSAASLSHPNICTIYEVDEENGELFIAMEYCDGQPLSNLIRKGALEWTLAVSIVVQVAGALAEAHRRKIVHRDVKSSNIMIDTRNRARLLDFGLAVPTLMDATVTMGCVGTPAYMAPERFEAGGSDGRADIWALGVVLYEALTGRMPFTGDLGRLASSILNEHPAPASSLVPGLPFEIDNVIDRSLTKDPADRYQSVGDMIADLSSLVQPFSAGATAGSSSVAPESQGASAPGGTFDRRR